MPPFSEELLSSLKAELRSSLAGDSDRPLAVAHAVDAVVGARRGTTSRRDAVSAAAHLLATFPEVRRGSGGERVRTAVRLVREHARSVDLDGDDAAGKLLELVHRSASPGDLPADLGVAAIVAILTLAGELPDVADDGKAPVPGASSPAEGDQPPDVDEALLAFELSADDVASQLTAAGRGLAEDGTLPPAAVADVLDDLLATAAQLSQTVPAPASVGEVRVAALATASTVDPALRRAEAVATLTGPEDAGDVLRSVRAAAERVVGGDADERVREVVEALFEAIDLGSSDRLESVEDGLMDLGIRPLALSRLIAQIQLGDGARAATDAAAEQPEVDAEAPAKEPPVLVAADDVTEPVAPDVVAPTPPPAGETAKPGDAPAKPSLAVAVPALASPANQPASSERSTALLADLIPTDPMLASLLVTAGDGSEKLAAALEGLALSRALGDKDGPTAEALDHLLLTHADRPGESRLDAPILVAAAIGLALHAPGRSTLLALAQPPVELAYSPALGKASVAIAAGVTRGALSREHVDAATRQAALEQELQDLVKQAAALARELPRRDTRHGPARRTWKALIAPRGIFGRTLESIAQGSANVVEVEGLLADWQDFDKQLDAVCAEFGDVREKVVSGVRSWLTNNSRTVLGVAERWTHAMRQLEYVEQGPGVGRAQAFADQRRTLLAAVSEALAEITPRLDAADAVERACLRVLRDRFIETKNAINGEWATVPDLSPEVVRSAPLARAWELELDSDMRPTADPPAVVTSLEHAAERGVPEAVRRQVERGNLRLAAAAVHALGTSANGATVAELDQLILAARQEAEAEDRRRAGDAALNAARLFRIGIIDAAQQAGLEGALSRTAEIEGGRLDLRRQAVDQVVSELKEAEASRRAELDHKLASTTADDADRLLIQAALDRGDLAVVEDQLLRLERGESLAVASRPPLLEPFIEAISAAAPDARTIVDALARGVDIPGFPCSVLDEDERRRVRVAVKALSDLDAVARSRVTRKAVASHLRSVGEVAGLDVVERSIKLAARSPRGLMLATVDVIPGVAEWRPPQHVSPEGPRQRRTHQVVVWAGAPVAQVLDALDSAASLPGVILTATPQSLERRRQLEREASKRSASFLFVDACVLVHAAIVGATGNIPPFAVIAATSMALGRTNPYVAAGPVHHEMFMGRVSESANIRDFGGAATVYGGRQLGKSALLRDIERAVNDPGDEQRAASVRACYIDLKREGVGDRLPADTVWPVIADSLTRLGVDRFAGRRTQQEVSSGIEDHLKVGSNELRLFLDEADEFLRKESTTGFPNVYAFRQLVEDYPDRFKVVLAGLHSVNRFRRIPNQPLAQLGSPERIGPLSWEEARQLVLRPLEALGYRFESETLVDLMLVETRRHANLIQFACKRLIEHVSQRAEKNGETTPLAITRDDLAAIFERDDQFREWLRERFELTLNLYRHYKVLALLLAMEAHADDAVRLDGLQLRDLERLAREWWPEGFADMTPDEFSVVVEEMENLEVLALDKRTGRYRLPSVNLIRLLGGTDEIERHLLAEIERPPESTDDGAQHDRRGRPDGEGRSVLTYDDERRLLGPDQLPVTFVLGSRALGVDQVVQDIEQAAASAEWARPTFNRTLTVGAKLAAVPPKGLVVIQLRASGRRPDEVVRWAVSVGRELDDGRGFVIVLDDGWIDRWLDIIDEIELTAPDVAQVLVLKRWNRGALRRVLEDLGSSAERADLWGVATGGFHAAVAQLSPAHVVDNDAEDVAQFSQLLASTSGLERVPLAAAVLRCLAEFGPGSAADLREMLGSESALVEVDAAARLLTLIGLARSDRAGYLLSDRVPAAAIAAAL